MGLFRVGKPYIIRRRLTEFVAPAAQFHVPWQTDEVQGEWEDIGDTHVSVQVAGLYLITLTLSRGLGGGSTPHQALIEVNGTAHVQAHSDQAASFRSCSVSTVVQLQRSETLKALAAGWTVGSTIRPEYSEMTAVRIGPVRWT